MKVTTASAVSANCWRKRRPKVCWYCSPMKSRAAILLKTGSNNNMSVREQQVGNKAPATVPSYPAIKLLIESREKDIGGFTVRRLLPHAKQRLVGPFIFFDHMGPVQFAPGQGVDVRPHPHINLATVTYLFEGAFMHRDSLGSEQLIEPGAINWMTAGSGIVHSERTP